MVACSVTELVRVPIHPKTEFSRIPLLVHQGLYALDQGIVPAGQVAAVRERRDVLLARLRALDPADEPQHGDAFPRNAVVDARGRVTWIDLEDACRASRAWDLAVLVRSTRDERVRAAAEERVGRDALETALELRELQAGVWNALHDARIARGW